MLFPSVEVLQQLRASVSADSFARLKTYIDIELNRCRQLIPNFTAAMPELDCDSDSDSDSDNRPTSTSQRPAPARPCPMSNLDSDSDNYDDDDGNAPAAPEDTDTDTDGDHEADSVLENGKDGIFFVEKVGPFISYPSLFQIVQHRVQKGQQSYLVRWKGFDAKDDNWEPRMYRIVISPHLIRLEESFLDPSPIILYWRYYNFPKGLSHKEKAAVAKVFGRQIAPSTNISRHILARSLWKPVPTPDHYIYQVSETKAKKEKVKKRKARTEKARLSNAEKRRAQSQKLNQGRKRRRHTTVRVASTSCLF